MTDKPKPPPEPLSAARLLWDDTAAAQEGRDPLPFPKVIPTKPFAEALKFLEGLTHAKKYGMHYEYTQDVIEELKAGRSIDEAIWHANREWDL